MGKALLIGGTLICMLLSEGCLATPGYSSDERNQMIGRNMDYDGKQMVDDFDSLMLLRPASHMNIWAVQ